MPAKSQAQRGYLAVKFGPAWMKRHGYDTVGPLPKRIHPKKQKPKAKKKGKK